jgi:hypothetical protein
LARPALSLASPRTSAICPKTLYEHSVTGFRLWTPPFRGAISCAASRSRAIPRRAAQFPRALGLRDARRLTRSRLSEAPWTRGRAGATEAARAGTTTGATREAPAGRLLPRGDRATGTTRTGAAVGPRTEATSARSPPPPGAAPGGYDPRAPPGAYGGAGVPAGQIDLQNIVNTVHAAQQGAHAAYPGPPGCGTRGRLRRTRRRVRGGTGTGPGTRRVSPGTPRDARSPVRVRRPPGSADGRGGSFSRSPPRARRASRRPVPAARSRRRFFVRARARAR